VQNRVCKIVSRFRFFRLTSLILLSAGVLLAFTPRAITHVTAFLAAPVAIARTEVPHPQPTQTVEYRTYPTPKGIAHVLKVPTATFEVSPVVAEGVAQLEEFAQTSGAIAGVNGGFFDPVNQQTTSYIVVQGEVMADPTQNDRLMTNPEMIPYLDQILNRSEFRRYQCGEEMQYDIAAHLAPVPSGCELNASLGAGPRLLPQLSLTEEAFAEMVDGEFVRDAIGSRFPNARTAIGITETGEILFVMASQLSEAPTDSGMTLPELAELMETLGAIQAMNLDGGSSSALYYQGQTQYGRVNAEGDRIQRPVKSVLLVHER
jgi:hypothetical protein